MDDGIGQGTPWTNVSVVAVALFLVSVFGWMAYDVYRAIPQPASAAEPAKPAFWEDLGEHTGRARVPGGWVIRAMKRSNSGGIALLFIPDPGHEWEVR